MPAVLALFQESAKAEQAIAELSLNGFTEKDVSLVIFSAVMPPKPGRSRGLIGWLSRGGALGDTIDRSDGVSVMDGIGVGAVIGGLLGIILGSEWNYGPIAYGAIGIIAGGLIGLLIDRLIPEKRKDQFELYKATGLLLVQVYTPVAAQAQSARRLLEACSAKQVAVLPERMAR